MTWVSGHYRKARDSAGLNRVKVSLDSLKPEQYRQITRGGDTYDVMDGIAEAEKAGLLSVKVGMILIRGINDYDIEGSPA